MDQMTTEQAIAFAESGKWKDMTHFERAAFQLHHAKLCMPFEVFHESVEAALGRPVWTHEFGLNWQGLKDELVGKATAPTLEQIIEMIPAQKRMVVVS